VLDPNATDREVVDAVLSGDRDAFGILVERESRGVYATCRKVLGSPTDAQDAAQEAFTRAYTSLATFRGDGPFGAWIHRIAVRISVERLALAHAAVSLDDDRLHVGQEDGQDADPVDRMLDTEERTVLVDAIGRLPADQRDVVTLRFFGDRSVEEIARLTHRPVGTVKSRLSRGVANLRHQLDTRSAR
jgi:RNA polymerase sigma-70 factor (ECF subfamily)